MKARSPYEQYCARMVALAQMANFALGDEMADVYEMQLEPMGWENVVRALDEIISARGSRDPFPSVKEIKEKLTPTASPEVEAQHIAGLINQAIAKVGPYQSVRFRSFVGEIGWKVVQMAGGLEAICAVTDREIGTHRAQWKQMALAEMKFEEMRARQGGPALEHKRGEGGLHSMGGLLTEIKERSHVQDERQPGPSAPHPRTEAPNEDEE